MRGTRLHGRRRLGAWGVAATLALLQAAALLVPGAARADSTPLPGTMSTAAQNTSSFDVPVPAGVKVRAITGVLTMPEVVEGGTVTFRVNGAVRKTVPSALYQKVRIPLNRPDVIANGTVGLTMTTEGPAVPGTSCLPAAGVASMRKIALDYGGAEVPPTSLADFFPATAASISVVIPANADDDMITAGLTAVAALAYRYDETPVDLALKVPSAETATAGQRVVALVPGPAGQVATAVSTTAGIPMLTLTGAGTDLVDAARALSTDTLGLSGADAENPSLEAKPRNTATTRTLADLGVDGLTVTGYGSITQQLELRQDSFGVPVSSMKLHLEGSHTAFPAASGARLDVRANGSLIGSTVLGDEARFALDVPIPAGTLRSVNHLEVTLNAVAPDGSACTPPAIPPAEVDVDTRASQVVVVHGTGQTKGFQLFPQIYAGTLPVALRAGPGRKASAAINAAALIAALQRAAGSPLEIQLMEPNTFLADDRSGLIVGALSADSEALDAPLKLSSTRLLDRDDSTQEITSQEPYAALESIDRNNRLVLMLGSWAPGNLAAPGALARKIVDAVVNTGWENLDGDLIIADQANPAFVAASRSLAPHQQVEEQRSYAKWFVVVIALLLLLLALQVVIAIRRDRRLSRERDDYDDNGAAYVEDEPDYEVDALGDVDDLGLHEYADDTVGYPEEELESGVRAGDVSDLGEYQAEEHQADQYEDEYQDEYQDEYRDEYEAQDEDAELEEDAESEEAAEDYEGAGPVGADLAGQETAGVELEYDDEDALPPTPALPPWRRHGADAEPDEDGAEAPDEPEDTGSAVPTPPRRRWSDTHRPGPPLRPAAPAEPAEPLEPPSTPPPKPASPSARRRTRRRPKAD